MRKRHLCVSSVVGVALLALAGSASAAPTLASYSTNPASVAPNATVTLTATCPTGTLNVGGGFEGDGSFVVYKSVKYDSGSTHGWQVQAKNITSGYGTIYGWVNCMSGAPSKAAVTTVTASKATVANKGTGSSTATCSSGVIIGGGFVTDLGSGATPVMVIYLDGRPSAGSSSWRASAYNTTGASKSVTAYAYCLTNYSGASSVQNSAPLQPEGMAEAGCSSPSIAVGGGYSISRTVGNVPIQMLNESSNVYDCDMNYTLNTGDPDPNSLSYAECLTAP